jgi:UDP-N-acetylmuramyl pentapeptide phosphotransferase/UDP-N-acetylglucosamine-1-phosphate transferase
MLALLVTTVGTAAYVRLARAWQLVDRPNARSSHRSPTPTGGGVAIVAGVAAGAWALASQSQGEGLLLGPGLRAWSAAAAVLLLLWVDDVVRPLNVGEKSLLLVAATGLWLGLGPHFEQLEVPGLICADLGAWGGPLTAFWLLAVSNAFNFMDGIDGITCTGTLSAAALIAVSLAHLGVAWGEVALIGVAAAGFLAFNRPPARIFMGDVGSTFLGFTLAGISILATRHGLPVGLLVLYLGYHAFDTSYTLARRAARGENVTVAHRKHLYQRLCRLGWSPGRVDLWVLAVNLLLGSGGYLIILMGTPWGWPLVAGGLLLLAAEVIWVERRDPDFV